MDLCQKDESKQFNDGFVDLLVLYFEEIERYAELLVLDDDIADVDLTLPLEDALKELNRNKASGEYWNGVALAAKLSDQMLSFAFEMNSNDKVA